MRIVAFGPSLQAAEAPDGGIDALGFPMTSCFVEELPAEITVPVVIAACALNGENYHVERYLAALSPQGDRISAMQFSWQWDDDADIGMKYRAFVQYLPIWVETPGVYTLGLFDSPDADLASVEAGYPLAIFQQNNPFLVPLTTPLTP